MRERPDRGYLICFVPRSGSTWLCDMLSHTHKMGYPREFFHPKKIEEAVKGGKHETVGDYLKDVLYEGTSENGIWGAKVTWQHLQFLIHQGETPHEVLGIPLKYIWLDREDRHAQAISDYKAMEEFYYHSTMTKPEKKAVFDPIRIKEVQDYLDHERSEFLAWFRKNEIIPAMSLTYEQLERDPQLVVDTMCGWYDINPGPVKYTLEKIETVDDEIWNLVYKQGMI